MQKIVRRAGTGVIVLSLLAIGILLVLRPTTAVVDEPTYETVEELAAAADLVVLGVVTEQAHRFIDRGGDPEVDDEGEAMIGVPMVAVDVRVTEWILGKSPDVISVVMTDGEAVQIEGRTPLQAGEEVILFLDEVTAHEAPAAEEVGGVSWVPLSGDNAVFDVVGQAAIPRTERSISIQSEPIPFESGIPVERLIGVAATE